MRTAFTAISLFAGAVDGLGLAAQVAGINVSHHLEINAWCCRVLRKNFPRSVVIEDDIRNVRSIPTTDVLFGSPPCQGWSSAGTGRGADDTRNLWPDMFRLVQQSRPRCILVENVFGGIAKGYIDLICGNLEAAGYEAQALVYPAAAFGAPHLRTRVFVVAHTHCYRRYEPCAEQDPRDDFYGNNSSSKCTGQTEFYATVSSCAMGCRIPLGAGSQVIGQPLRSNRNPKYEYPEPRMVGKSDGTATGLDDFAGFPNYLGLPQHPHEPSRTISTRGAYHKERVAACGNAVVWQQAYPLMRGIKRWLEAQL